MSISIFWTEQGDKLIAPGGRFVLVACNLGHWHLYDYSCTQKPVHVTTFVKPSDARMYLERYWIGVPYNR